MDRWKWVERIAAFTSCLKHTIRPSVSPTLMFGMHVPDKVKDEEILARTYGRTGEWIFCQIAKQEDLIYSDEKIVAFFDHKPRSKWHIQVIPRAHIQNLQELTPRDADLIKHMYLIGEKLLRERFSESEFRFGFHIPPRNSIDHLHLHCIVLPISDLLSKVAYSNYLWMMHPLDVLKKLKSLESGS